MSRFLDMGLTISAQPQSYRVSNYGDLIDADCFTLVDKLWEVGLCHPDSEPHVEPQKHAHCKDIGPLSFVGGMSYFIAFGEFWFCMSSSDETGSDA
jgi:hypothetical protein